MARLPTIHLIHASDAPQHLGKLQGILQKLKEENRIAEFVTLSPDDQLANLTEQVKDDDLVLTLLTHEFEPHKVEIESLLSTMKTSHTGIKVAEVIVDLVSYKKEFITFPSDLKPIRGRENMTVIWADIEQSLKDMFSAQVKDPASDLGWKKYLKYAIPGIVVVTLLLWWFFWDYNGLMAEFTANMTECEAPCTIDFNNTSQNADTYRWDFGDGQKSNESNPSHRYNQPGNYYVLLIAQKGKQQKYSENTLKITSPEDNIVFRVTDVAVSVSGTADFIGTCPHKFDFTGKIMVNKAGTVSYTWLRSDGATAPVQTLNFSEAGSQTVSTSWIFGEAGNSYSNYSIELKTIKPSGRSDGARVNLSCEE